MSEQLFLEKEALSKRILPWYDQHARTLPWRSRSEEKNHPYRVWLSEIMLQQTTVSAVIPYFLSFLQRWPTVYDLAKAPIDDILHAWQGLGYYARARNLHKCANIIVNQFQGIFPHDEKNLLSLPGVGPYTAAAIGAIAFNQPYGAVDGNIERVLCRIYALSEPLPEIKKHLKILSIHHVPIQRSGDYTQALMDLGSQICTPKKPLCLPCPFQDICQAKREKTPDRYPLRAAKTEKPTRYMTSLWLQDLKGNIFLEKRPPTGLFGGLILTPFLIEDQEFRMPPQLPTWIHYETIQHQELISSHVFHTFTHFHLIVRILKIICTELKHPSEPYFLSHEAILRTHAMPTLMKKIIQQVFESVYKKGDDKD